MVRCKPTIKLLIQTKDPMLEGEKKKQGKIGLNYLNFFIFWNKNLLKHVERAGKEKLLLSPGVKILLQHINQNHIFYGSNDGRFT